MALTSPGLIKAANDALVGISADINVAKLFANDLSDEFVEFGATVKVPVATATAAEYNASTNDYENDSGSVTYVNVVLNHHPKSTMKAPNMAAYEAPNAPYWPRCTSAMVNAISGSISTGLGGLFTTTACAGGKAVLAAVTKANIAKLRKDCLGRVADTVLALGSDEFNEALSLFDSAVYGGTEAVRSGVIPGLFGFKAVIPMKDLPSGVIGALIPADSVAVAARGTLKTDAGFIEAGTVADENGFPVTITRHMSPAKREEFLNADLVWGAALVQASKIKYIAAA